MAIRLLGVSGSMREGSRATALRVALTAAKELGAEPRFLDLRELDMPMFRPRTTSRPPSVILASEAVNWADAFIICSPDYHGSMSGAVKNFLDHHWKEFAGKLFGYLCTSDEKGLTVMDQMRTAVRQCYGWSLPYGVSLNAREDFDGEGNIKTPAVERRLKMIARDMVVYGGLIRGQFNADVSGGVIDTFAAKYRG